MKIDISKLKNTKAEILNAVDLLSEENHKVPLTGVSARTVIIGSGARTVLRQRFRNDEKIVIEAIYKFPLPADAAVCGFRIETGGKIITGAAEERRKAYDLYDKALEKGNSAYLLDEERPNLFTISAGNLLPGQEAVIETELVSRLEYRGGAMRFFLPTAIGPRYVPAKMPDKDGIPVDAQLNPPFALSVPYGIEIEVVIENKADLKGIESHSHRVKTVFKGGKTIVSLSGDLVPMDQDFILDLQLEDAAKTRAYCAADKNYSYLGVDFSLPAQKLTLKKPASELVFVLDCSGSMQGDSISQSKQALQILLKSLAPGNKFNVYRFGSSFEKLFASSLAMDKDSLSLALQWLNKVQADLGGTELLAPLRDIYSAPSKDRDIIVLTDGDIGNESDIAAVAQTKNSAGTRLHLVGIGHGPNEHLLKSASRAGKGLSLMIAPAERIEPPMLRLYGAIRGGCLSEVKVDCGVKTAEPSGVPSVIFTGGFDSFYLRLPKGKLPETVEFSGEFAGKKQSFKIAVAQVENSFAPLSVLWARAKVRELESAGKESEAVALAKEYTLASAGTSFVGVQERKAGEKQKGEIALRQIAVVPVKGWGALNEVCDCDMNMSMSMSVAAPRAMSMKRCFNLQSSMAEYKPGMISRPRARMSMSIPSFTPPQDDLLIILGCQRLEGGFALQESIFHMLGLNWAGFQKALAGASAKDQVLAFTMVILKTLEAKYAARRSEWEPMLEKTRDWLAVETAKTQLKIKGQSLQAWVKAFLVN
ncbi:MAG: VIT and VWA domain-containing protein [Elusimicrobiota bacterium]|nr:VIT and VWA domain-containing protein [Elusimicrobiota bacterium]